MCGICGVFNLNGNSIDSSLVENMMGAMVHRGPDDYGEYLDGGINLGMRRLSIIDVAGGSQPLYNENGNIIVFQNGEIFNFSVYKLYNRENPYAIYFRTIDAEDAEKFDGAVEGNTAAFQTTLFKIIPAITWNFEF